MRALVSAILHTSHRSCKSNEREEETKKERKREKKSESERERERERESGIIRAAHASGK